MNEALRTVDGRNMLRIERRLAHPPQKVWRALTEPEQLGQWYPARVAQMDLRVGGEILFDYGEGTILRAVITELDPPRRFAFSENAGAALSREDDAQLSFTLEPDGDSTLLVFTHVFDDRAAAASYATGWQGCLDCMALVLNDQPVTWPPRDMAALYRAYVHEFGLDKGAVETTVDGWRVRFERQLMQESIDDVWTELTGSHRDTRSEQARPPAAGNAVPGWFVPSFIRAGTVVTSEAPTLLEYDWYIDNAPAGRVRWELTEGPGGARILLTQTGPPERTGDIDAALAGWRNHLNALASRGQDQAATP